jgi:hypothetical protein
MVFFGVFEWVHTHFTHNFTHIAFAVGGGKIKIKGV